MSNLRQKNCERLDGLSCSLYIHSFSRSFRGLLIYFSILLRKGITDRFLERNVCIGMILRLILSYIKVYDNKVRFFSERPERRTPELSHKYSISVAYKNLGTPMVTVCVVSKNFCGPVHVCFWGFSSNC